MFRVCSKHQLNEKVNAASKRNEFVTIQLSLNWVGKDVLFALGT